MHSTGNKTLKSCLPGFENINRYRDTLHKRNAAKILPGEYYVTPHNELIVTVLGSCVSACIRDPYAAIGGMNHFMLPLTPNSNIKSKDSEATRYGNFAMEQLINEVIKQGGKKERLEIKLFGGGNVLSALTDIGQQNIQFVWDYLKEEGLSTLSHDLGDRYPRKVYYSPRSGRVRVKKIKELRNKNLFNRETQYLDDLTSHPVSGEVELFD